MISHPKTNGGAADTNRVAITQAAFDAIASTRSGRSAMRPTPPTSANYFVWLETRWERKLTALRGPGESYSDVIVRLAAEGARYGSINHNGA